MLHYEVYISVISCKKLLGSTVEKAEDMMEQQVGLEKSIA